MEKDSFNNTVVNQQLKIKVMCIKELIVHLLISHRGPLKPAGHWQM